MPNPSRAVDALAHPVSVVLATVASVLAVVTSVLPIELWAWFVANSPALFTFSSIFGFTIAPQLEWLPAGPLVAVAIVSGATFGAWKLYGALKNLQTRL